MLRFKTQGNNLFLHNLSKKKNSVASSSMSRENMVEFNMPVFFFFFSEHTISGYIYGSWIAKKYFYESIIYGPIFAELILHTIWAIAS